MGNGYHFPTFNNSAADDYVNAFLGKIMLTLYKWKYYNQIELKCLWQKENLIIMQFLQKSSAADASESVRMCEMVNLRL